MKTEVLGTLANFPPKPLSLMPRKYEHIKESELRAGKSLKEAKSIAAATFIKQGGDPRALHHKKKRRRSRSVGDSYTSKYY